MTNAKFKEYKRIRDEGMTNMYHVTNVVRFSEGILTRFDCIDIMENFDKYEEGIFDE